MLGKHEGIVNYTIGQRKGLGVAAGEPLYVVKLEHRTSRVIVGPREALMTKTVRLRDVNWLGERQLASTRGRQWHADRGEGALDAAAAVRRACTWRDGEVFVTLFARRIRHLAGAGLRVLRR